MEAYDIYAPWYDLQNEMEDVDFYLEALQDFGGPILDAGCGTGRLLLEFAREGYSVGGFDTSQEMLKVGRNKIAKESKDVQSRIEMTYGDMRQFQLKQSFNIGVFGCNTFQHLLTNEEQDQALQSMHKHLNDDGRLFIQTTNVKFHEHDSDVLYHRGREFHAPTNEWIDSFYSYHYFQHLQIQQFTLFLDITNAEGLVKRKQVILNLRFLFPPELERMLKHIPNSIGAMQLFKRDL